ncbi:MAG: hypothetical protein M1831_001553 [Alyxoria varia]|nr:MAG: hypothetical protein M1831_001553 [Alyxoria varia]
MGKKQGLERRSPSLTPSSTASSSQPNTTKLRVGIDFGTKYTKVCWALSPNMERLELDDVHYVHFENGDIICPSLLTYDDKNKLVWGSDVVDRIESNNMKAERCLSTLKASFYDSEDAVDFKEQTQDALEYVGKDNHEVLGDLFRELVSAAQADAIAEEPEHAMNAELKLFLTVPQHFDPGTVNGYLKAAVSVGLPRPRFIYESESALAFFGIKAYDWFKDGQVVMICDVGGSTCDTITFELKQISGWSNKFKYRLKGRPEGFICGSESINVAFRKWLSRQIDHNIAGMYDKVQNSGRTRAGYEMQAAQKFEKARLSFAESMDEFCELRITPSHRSGYETKIRIPNENMMEFMNPVFKKTVQHIKRGLHRRTSVVALSGGLGRNAAFVAYLRNEFETSNITIEPITEWRSNCICGGALIREESIELSDMPQNYAFGVHRAEVQFDRKVHQDATRLDPWGGRHEDGRVVFKASDGSGIKVVLDRVEWLVHKQGQVDEGEVRLSKEVTEYRDIPVDSPNNTAYIELPIYWTSHDMKDHAPVFPWNARGEMNDSINEWGTLKKWIQKLPTRGFEILTDENDLEGQQYYRVWFGIAIKVVGPNVDIMWRVCKDRPQQNDLGEPKDISLKDFEHYQFDFRKASGTRRRED